MCKVEAVNLSKVYRDGTKAVDNVTFQISKGITVMMGPNGSGKTTTMSMIAGVLKPTKGQIYVCDHEVWGKGWFEARKHIGYAPQNMPFKDKLNVVENLIWLGMLAGIGLLEARREALRVLEIVGLKEYSRKRIGQLSGGMRRRLSIGAALLTDPDVILLDEPTSGLDPGIRVEIWEILKSISNEKTVLVSTHLPEEAEIHGDYVLVFHRGKIVGEGSPQYLIKKYSPNSIIIVKGNIPSDTSFNGINLVFMDDTTVKVSSNDPDKDLVKIIELIIDNGGRVAEAKIKRPGLSEVYFVLTGEGMEGE